MPLKMSFAQIIFQLVIHLERENELFFIKDNFSFNF